VATSSSESVSPYLSLSSWSLLARSASGYINANANTVFIYFTFNFDMKSHIVGNMNSLKNKNNVSVFWSCYIISEGDVYYRSVKKSGTFPTLVDMGSLPDLTCSQYFGVLIPMIVMKNNNCLKIVGKL